MRCHGLTLILRRIERDSRAILFVGFAANFASLTRSPFLDKEKRVIIMAKKSKSERRN